MRYLFEDYALDPDRRELRRGATPVRVEPQVLDLLLYLVRNRERVVGKEEVLSSVWQGRVVSDSAVSTRINSVRAAVGDDGERQRLIRTFARKGLRFVGEVTEEGDVSASAPGGSRPPAALPQKPVIAVLPFANLSGDREQEYFSDGISEDLLGALSKLRWFQVIARNSSFVFKGRPVPIKQIAEELGVDYVVEGSVRKGGERVRIGVQLNDVRTGSQVWAERYDRHLADVFTVQDEITEAIVATVEPRLYAAESFRAQRKPPDSLDAWELVMRALAHYWRVTPHDNLVAQALLEKAISIDPGYAQALGVLGASHMFGTHMGWEDIERTGSLTRRLALAALQVDSEDAWPHHALACAHLFERRWADSLAEFELALMLNPNFSQARGYYALALSYSGRCAEADRAAERALRLSPRDPFSQVYAGIRGFAQFLAGNYPEAMRLASEGTRLHTEFAGGYRVLTAAAGMAGASSVAASALAQLRQAQPNISLDWVATQMPFEHEADRRHYVEGFRRAGLT